MHTWPQLRNLVRAQVSATFSASTSPNTRTGPWPPSSMETFFTPSAARCRICLPTGTEPVTDTLRTMGDEIRCRAIISELPVTKLTTPFGTPASWQAWTRAAQDAGASPAGLTMMLQPAPKAAAILRAGSNAGKFQAENAATTPTG